MSLNIHFFQFNPMLGDFAGNATRILAAARAQKDADIFLTPEMSLSGYQPEDLALHRDFVRAGMNAAQKLAAQTEQKAIVVGLPWEESGHIYNAAVVMQDGKIIRCVFKHELPNHEVFDEPRVFTPGSLPEPVTIKGVKIGLMLCEDMWHQPVAEHLKKRGAQFLVSMNGSPFDAEKDLVRKGHAFERVKETGLPLLYVNLLGGQDDVVYDGASFVYDAGGKMLAQAPAWREFSGAVLFEGGKLLPQFPHTPREDADEAEIYAALVLGVRDYIYKNGFSSVLLGLSGGIDSAIVAAIAADALGPDKVRGVMMPSPYTSKESIEDAAQVAELLSIQLDIVPIEPMMRVAEEQIGKAEKLSGLALENLQSRLRGLSLMALSNQTGALLLSTGNKSELATGYATLYGDMCGAFAPLKDVYKTRVFDLCRWRNAQSPVMPQRVIDKPPSAELRPGQRDDDSLPPYPILDKILHKLIEQDQGVAEIVAHGFERDLVLKIAALLDKAEYKRRQAPPGVKISSRAFGRDRRWPITQGFQRKNA